MPGFTTDVTTDFGKLRLLITDRDPREPIFDDDDLTTFLALEGGTLKKAAALALETIAVDEVLVLRVIKILQLTVDGAKVSDALLKRAALLRSQASAEVADEEAAPLDIAEWSIDSFNVAEIYANRWRRGI